MKNITVLGIDLAKNVFQLHGVNEVGQCVLKKRLSRSELCTYVVKLTPCIIGIEACMGSHYWARCFTKMGHTVKMIAPHFVKPYVKSNKNDAEAIAEAVMRPEMRFVAIKSVEQQDMQLVHTVRQLQVKQRTALGNQIRGLLSGYGITLPTGINRIRSELCGVISDTVNGLTVKAREMFGMLYEEFKRFDEQVNKYDAQIERVAKEDERCQRLCKIEGIGPITATAIVAEIGDGKAFKQGRELSAWLGLVPRQHSSGNKTRLLGISKRGNAYLRTLLIHGARAVVRTCGNKKDARSQWILSKKLGAGENKAAVALANKNARIIWAVLSRNEAYRPSAVAA